ncbi:GNAT family N-acetyltransferase [Octadecabacter sp. G9-8]|uniref:GNAT family N-acetyltransferase n=1 Tax=Octadecabacter dasysiphoniae TaxID=2909341 RepID=A0ABS9CXU2_9RHOB|nr:GNAT family N-acetyltransferase [Octadecabacter dasysiphoniae]
MKIEHGFHEEERRAVAALYWAVFGPKLNAVMGPMDRGLAFVEDVLDPSHALCARDDDGQLLGVAGFKTYEGALVGGTARDMANHYGWISSLWRMGLISLLERDTENKRFLMDGIFVSEHARGKGVGTALLNAICDEARTRGYVEVRLDVIDSNPRARALYDREGFIATDTHHLGLLRHIFGFQSATTMIKRI